MTPEQAKYAIRFYAPAVLLDLVISRHTRELIKNAIGLIAALLIIVRIVGYGTSLVNGLFFIVLAAWIVLWLFDFFYNSYYFRELEGNAPVSFAVAAVLSVAEGGDVVRAFLNSHEGRWIMARTGIDSDAVKAFCERRLISALPAKLTIQADPSGTITLHEFAKALLDADSEFAQFILQSGVEKADVVGSADWYEWSDRNRGRALRWWSRESLGKVPGIAKDWTYGQTFFLDKYSRDLLIEATRSDVSTNGAYKMDEVEKLEAILSRSHDANAVLVGEQGAGIMDVVYLFAKKIEEGTIFPQLEHKRMLMLDTTSLIAVSKVKADFELEFMRMMNEAIRAGNVILVIDNLPEFVQNSRIIGSDVVTLMEPYLASHATQIVAMASPKGFHELIETNATLGRRFEKVFVKETDDRTLLRYLEHEVEKYEQKHKVFFVYPAVRAIAESAGRYFGDAPALDRSADMLSELIPFAKQAGKHVIAKADILELVEKKTGIPLGEITYGERDKLLGLETTLHQRIIGQKEAVTAISNAMRRARSGVANPNRPIGSFLFIGPTGVGKTETTKALAHAFFGNDSQIMRLDMSEYKTDDSLHRLIGSFSDGKSGILSSMLRDKQYGVLLLDEFEKTNKQVLDLFLSILDEGFFSDMNGKRVNARNMIIIATSNAGSDLIWEAMKTGENLESKKSFIIDQIIANGVFKPELLNRFDGVILFHPLAKEDLGKIAVLMLKKLSKRLEDKGLQLAVTDELVEYLVREGADPKFGARSMNRAIQERVEQVIAEKIIRGEAAPGTVLTIGEADLK